MAKSVAPSLTPVDVMIGWLGTKEIPGRRANPVIAGRATSWSDLVDRPEIDSDEVANCAMAVGAAIVTCEFLKAGFDPEVDLKEGGPSAITQLAAQGVNVVLPPKDQRLLAQSYNSFGRDARKDPRRGDIFVIRRGKSWQGHIMFIVAFNHVTKIAKCIGANQGDAVTYAEHHIAEAIAVRRYVPATIKDLRVAGSTTIAQADMQQTAGVALSVGAPAVAAAKTLAESSGTVAQPLVDAVASNPNVLEPIATNAGHAMSITSAGSAIGTLFVQNPWLIGCIGLGILVWWLGRTGKLTRLAQHVAGLPISSQTAST